MLQHTHMIGPLLPETTIGYNLVALFGGNILFNWNTLQSHIFWSTIARYAQPSYASCS